MLRGGRAIRGHLYPARTRCNWMYAYKRIRGLYQVPGRHQRRFHSSATRLGCRSRDQKQVTVRTDPRRLSCRCPRSDGQTLPRQRKRPRLLSARPLLRNLYRGTKRDPPGASHPESLSRYRRDRQPRSPLLVEGVSRDTRGLIRYPFGVRRLLRRTRRRIHCLPRRKPHLPRRHHSRTHRVGCAKAVIR